MTRAGLSDDELLRIVRSPLGNDEVVPLESLLRDVILSDVLAGASRTLPAEVSIDRQLDGSVTVIEYFPDPGACEQHWVGVARRTPVVNGVPSRGAAEIVLTGSTSQYEAALHAFGQKDYMNAFKLLGHAVPWSDQMREAVKIRLGIALDDPDFVAKLAQNKLTIKAGKSVPLRAAPTSDAPVLTTMVAGDSGPGVPEALKLSRVSSSDGYIKIGGNGTWDLVLHVKTGEIGFIERTPDTLGTRDLAPATHLASR